MKMLLLDHVETNTDTYALRMKICFQVEMSNNATNSILLMDGFYWFC